MRQRTPEIVAVTVLALLVVLFAVFGSGGSGGDSGGGETVSPERLARVERRVEQLRGLRFKRPVSVTVMTPAEVEAYGVRDEQASESRERVEAGEELMKLLGLLAPDVDMDAVTASIYGEQVAGFYDPRTERLALVEGVGIDDVTLAHELTHALEDQHFDLQRLGGTGESSDSGTSSDDDRSSGESGLVEGSATAVMLRYLQRYPGALTFGDALDQLGAASGSTPLPPYIMSSLLFPYEQGEQFVEALLARGGWSTVNTALRSRPPLTTADLYEPSRWFARTRPASLSLPAGDAAGPGWRLLERSTLGEFDLRAVLAEAIGARAAATLSGGWQGGRYALWRQGPLPAPDCAAPCMQRDAFTLRLRFDSPAAAGAVAAAFGSWLAAEHDARRAAAAELAPRRAVDSAARGAPASGAVATATRWTLAGGTAAVTSADGADVTLTLAPTPALAARLSR
ncbi:hypothetical protein Q5424_05890 [Conexibacter sp. JD483]|uniref:hypothetical protein n=1 Tax=unclassified Conexibacter TaxID=2627773 RepID=UPI00271CC142|nr:MULTISPECIES: hypothetical protein [unclassified Conexibacter]MDO8185114.1 hypothetical protein [Conexibacter sp. CPCC 205706]MDO8196824.1 hypothetical protein [Conexibacter sp. CPCC 205762]MDR9368600.1 hypothetical protein [Conexibacter sp. JD483]